MAIIMRFIRANTCMKFSGGTKARARFYWKLYTTVQCGSHSWGEMDESREKFVLIRGITRGDDIQDEKFLSY